jgi:4-hydroxy-tetrahydrodipicolinate reductase
MIRIGICGIGGRMANIILDTIANDSELVLSGALARPGSPYIGMDAGMVAKSDTSGVIVNEKLDEFVEDLDVLIDFSSPESSLNNLEACARYSRSIVIGSTGFTQQEILLAQTLAMNIPVVLASNTSVGMNVVFKILADLAKIFSDDFDLEILDAHHRMKKDSPSGSAVRMCEIVSEVHGKDCETIANYSSQGICVERLKKDLGIQSIRGGDIVGEHTAYFIGIGERLELSTELIHERCLLWERSGLPSGFISSSPGYMICRTY